jgi:hypothetical protein
MGHPSGVASFFAWWYLREALGYEHDGMAAEAAEERAKAERSARGMPAEQVRGSRPKRPSGSRSIWKPSGARPWTRPTCRRCCATNRRIGGNGAAGGRRTPDPARPAPSGPRAAAHPRGRTGALGRRRAGLEG